MADTRSSFKLLPNEEFAKLSQQERIAYLKAAIEAMTRDVPTVAVLIPPTDTRH